MSLIDIRALTTIEELHKLEEVETAVWEMSSLPIHQTYTAMKNGGILLGAFDEQKMVGFLYSFAGFNEESVYLCSHMLGILPEYRKSGLGVDMKLKQAELAIQKGYKMITWTFDPLESKNAYLNLHKLGARGATYKENYYGNLNDKLNQGLPTDRIHIEWDIDKQTSRKGHVFHENKVLLTAGKAGIPIITDMFTQSLEADKWFVAIPWDFQKLKHENIELAKQWRYRTREVFQRLFEEGFQATDLLMDQAKNENYYVFTK